MGHAVVVQRGIGSGIGVSDEEHRRAGAAVVDTSRSFARSERMATWNELLRIAETAGATDAGVNRFPRRPART